MAGESVANETSGSKCAPTGGLRGGRKSLCKISHSARSSLALGLGAVKTDGFYLCVSFHHTRHESGYLPAVDHHSEEQQSQVQD